VKGQFGRGHVSPFTSAIPVPGPLEPGEPALLLQPQESAALPVLALNARAGTDPAGSCVNY